MSYQLGAAQPARTFMPSKVRPASPRPAWQRSTRTKFTKPTEPRDARIVMVPRVGRSRPAAGRPTWGNAQAVASAGGRVFIPAGSDLSGLGFSLKRPKWMRKMTLKKLVKPLLITAAVVTGAALIPGALPLLAKGALGAGKLAFGTGKLAVRGVTGIGKFAVKNVTSASKVFAAKSVATSSNKAKMETGPEDTTNAQMVVQFPSGGGGGAEPSNYGEQVSSAGSSLPLGTNADVAAGFATEPTQAGMSSSMLPLVIGGVALVAVMAMQKPGRRR